MITMIKSNMNVHEKKREESIGKPRELRTKVGKRVLRPILNHFVPLGYSKSRKTPRWMNGNAKAAMKINLESGLDLI